MSFCCTCAQPLSDTKVSYSAETEKPLTFTRTLECCNRSICASCQYENPRFETYCPFCQISSEPGGALPQTGLRLPPAYHSPNLQHAQSSALTESVEAEDERPPPYSSVISTSEEQVPSTSPSNGQDVVHHLSSDDSLHSLALSYGVPLTILRNHNSIYADHLLSARKFMLIPRSHYTGPSLSQPPDPVEEERKLKLRRWMISTKCADYDIAGIYLKGSDWDLERAIEAYKGDEKWEKEHPMQGNGKQKGGSSRNKTAMGLSGQLR